MYKDVLRSIVDIQIFPVIGLAIFLGFFIALLIYVIAMKKEYVRELSMLPCDEEETTGLQSRVGTDS